MQPLVNKKNIPRLIFGTLIFLFLLKKDYIFFDYSPSINYLSVIGVSLYFFAQCLKAFRLYIVYEFYEFSFSKFLRKYIQYNAILILLPFRLGDAYRIYYFKDFSSDFLKSFNILLAERFIDLMYLIFIAIAVMAISNFINKELIILFAGFIFFCFLILMTTEPSLKLIQNMLLRRCSKKKYFPILFQFVGKVGKSFNLIKIIMYKKFASLLSLTTLIWLIEISAFIFVLGLVNQFKIQIILMILFIMLSFILPLGPVGFGGIQLAVYWYSELTQTNLNTDFIISQCYIIYTSGLLLGLIALIYEKFLKQK